MEGSASRRPVGHVALVKVVRHQGDEQVQFMQHRFLWRFLSHNPPSAQSQGSEIIIIIIIIIIIMNVFLECETGSTALTKCKCKTRVYKTSKTACVQTIMLNYPTQQ